VLSRRRKSGCAPSLAIPDGPPSACRRGHANSPERLCEKPDQHRLLEILTKQVGLGVSARIAAPAAEEARCAKSLFICRSRTGNRRSQSIQENFCRARFLKCGYEIASVAICPLLRRLFSTSSLDEKPWNLHRRRGGKGMPARCDVQLAAAVRVSLPLPCRNLLCSR